VVLKEAGLSRYHHNLETSRSFFKEICTTHTFEERVATIKAAQQAGLECCSGGIIGMGETIEQRIELAFILKELNVNSVPINILNPIKGTRLFDQRPLLPMEIVKMMAIFRLILPDKELRYAGGREVNLRELQALGLLGGINGMLTGGYLTTGGRHANQDRQMVADLGIGRRKG
jgi:biotin synthase